MKRLTALTIALALPLAGCSTMNQQTRNCTITGKEATRNGDANQYRVCTQQCGTLKVADAITLGRWDSADLYSTLEPGHTYTITTGGYRIGIANEFPNIIEATEKQ